MRSRFRGSANVGPYTTIVGFLREYGEADYDLLAGQMVELEPDALSYYLDRLEKTGAIKRRNDVYRLADTRGRTRGRLQRA